MHPDTDSAGEGSRSQSRRSISMWLQQRVGSSYARVPGAPIKAHRGLAKRPPPEGW
jgi:hypothetical protein